MMEKGFCSARPSFLSLKKSSPHGLSKKALKKISEVVKSISSQFGKVTEMKMKEKTIYKWPPLSMK